MAGVFIKRENLDIKTDTHRGKIRRYEDTEKTAICRERSWEQVFPSQPSEGADSANQRDFGLLGSRTV